MKGKQGYWLFVIGYSDTFALGIMPVGYRGLGDLLEGPNLVHQYPMPHSAKAWRAADCLSPAPGGECLQFPKTLRPPCTTLAITPLTKTLRPWKEIAESSTQGRCTFIFHLAVIRY